MKNIIVIFGISLFLFVSCEKSGQSDIRSSEATVHPIVLELQKKYAPDKRVTIFSVSSIETDGKITVKGEVDNIEAKKELLSRFKTLNNQIIDSIDVLPAENLGEKTWGIITVSVANMRSDPRESAELGTQVLMGSLVRIWKKKGGYLFIQSPDKYLGWADADQLQRFNENEVEEWNKARKVFYTEMFGHIRQKPDENSYPVSDITGGAIVKDIGGADHWIKVGMADGRTGYIMKKNVADYKHWGTKINASSDKIERTAKFLMGVPYLWGGTSVKGVDCSGFTKTVFLLNGIMLDRDANQQAQQGTPVETGKDFSNLKKGDLLFFGRKADEGKSERITHVGIYLGNKDYIHSSGRVQINSFDKNSALFNEYNLNRFVRARRIIPSTPQVAEVKM